MTNELVKHEYGAVEIQNRSDELAKYWGKNNLTPQLRYQIAKVSVELGLDPFLRHMEVLGGNLYVTVAGLQHNAAKSGLLDGIKTRPIIGQERTEILEAFGMPKDTICFHALVYRKDAAQPFDGWGFASKADVSGQMQRPKDMAAMAENRAQARALRKAFAIGLTADIELGTDRPSRYDEEESAVSVDLNALPTVRQIAEENRVVENEPVDIESEPAPATDTQSEPAPITTGEIWQPYMCLNRAAILKVAKPTLESFVGSAFESWGPDECAAIQAGIVAIQNGADAKTVFTSKKQGD